MYLPCMEFTKTFMSGVGHCIPIFLMLNILMHHKNNRIHNVFFGMKEASLGEKKTPDILEFYSTKCRSLCNLSNV